MRFRSRVARTAALLVTCALLGTPAVAYAGPGTAATAAPLLVARSGHTATTLADGRVLVVGGDGEAGNPPGRAEVYDPETDTWTFTAPYGSERRAGHTATLLDDGRVLVVGGYWAANGYGPMPAALYDPVADTWSAVADGAGSRRHHEAVKLADGRVLVLGGDSYSRATVVYDPAAGTWAPAGETAITHNGPRAVLLDDGDVVVDGGDYGATIERWDAATSTWSDVAKQYSTRAVAIPGGALMSGYSGETLVYAASTNTLRRGGAMRSARHAGTSIALPTGEVLVVGGDYANAATSEIYDPSTDLWRDGPALGADRARPALAVTGDGDVLVVAGTTDRKRVDRVTPPDVPRPAPASTEPGAVLEAHLDRTEGRPGAPLGIAAHLFSRAADEPLAGEPVRLYARAAPAGEWTLAGTQFTDAHGGVNFAVAPTESTTYALRHPGTATAGQSVGPEPAYRVTGGSPVAPGWLERMVADPGDGKAWVQWLPPRDDGGKPVTEYGVTARRPDGSHVVTATVGGDAREVTLTGLTNDVHYEVHVEARTEAGKRASGTSVTPSASARPWPAPPTDGTRVCGRLPLGLTRFTTAGSPYHVCRLGLIVATGSTLEVTGAEVRFGPFGPTPSWWLAPTGLAVHGGGLRVSGSVLRGTDGVAGEWAGVSVDPSSSIPYGVARSSSTVSFAGSEIRHANDALRLYERASYLRLDDTVVATATGVGVQSVRMPARVRNLTVRDVGGVGMELTCRTASGTGSCPVHVDGVTVERAAGRGLLVDTPGPATVRNAVVTASGTKAPVSEAARLSGMTAAFGAGGDIEDVRGGGNGIDAVVLDLTHTRDLVWRTPVAGSATAPLPLGFLAGTVRMAKGRSITFPAGSVVKAVGSPYSSCDYYYSSPCVGTIDVTDATLDASAPGSVFTSVADASAGIATCPSTLAPKCGTDTAWRGLSVHDAATATLSGATVRHAWTGLLADGGSTTGAPGATATVAGTAFFDVGAAVRGHGHRTGFGGALTLTDVTVTRAGSTAITGYSFKTIALTRVTVTGAGSGVQLNGGEGQEGCSRRSQIAVEGLVVEDASGAAVELVSVCHPRVRDVVVRRSGRPGAEAQLGQPAVTLHGVFSLGPNADVDGITGGGNGLDAVSLNGFVSGNVAWLSPYNDPADHPLGYVLGGYGTPDGVTVRGGVVTVPADALVASLGRYSWYGASGALTLMGASLDASAGGARFVSATDRLAPELGCRMACGTAQWGGIRATGATETSPMGDVELDRATIRGGVVDLSSPADRVGAVVSITRTSSDSSVFVRRPTRAVVTDSRLPHLTVSGALSADVSRNTLTGSFSAGVVLSGRRQSTPTDLTMRDNVVTGAVAGPAYVLGSAHVAIGPGTPVDRNLASGEAAVLLLSGVTTPADLTWVTPTAEARPHPVGYVVGYYYALDQTPALTVTGPRRFTLPAGAVAKLSGKVVLRGATLDASAGGALITTVYDDTVGVDTCAYAYPYYSGTCGDPVLSERAGASPVTIEVVPDAASGKSGGVALRRARMHGSIAVTGPSADAPGATGYGVAVESSYVSGNLNVAGTLASVTRSRFTRGGLRLERGSGHVVRDVTFDGVAGTALHLENAIASVTETVVRKSAVAAGWYDTTSAIVLTGTSGGSWSCLDVRDNGAGVRAAGGALTLTDSALTGNARAGYTPTYDLDNEVAVTTNRVWWGQAGGPVAGQVRTPARHTDTAPAAARPACATADSAVPPSAPRSVSATADDNVVTALWAAPASDGGLPVSEYRVTLHPGNVTRVVAPTTRTVTFGATPGPAYTVTVTAVNAVGPGPVSRHSAPAHLTDNGTADPTPSTLGVSAPTIVTYGGDAVVTGTLRSDGDALGGRAVDLYVRKAGATTWGAPVATLTTSPSGTVARALRLDASSVVMLAYAGDRVSLGTSSPPRTVTVKPVISAAFSRTSVIRGQSSVLSGRVSPTLAGRRVRLERYTSTGWRAVAGVYLSSTSTYRFTVKPGVRGSFSYRVVYSATTTHARAVSRTRVLKVT